MPAPVISRTLVAEGAPRGGLAALCITQTTGWGVLYYALPAAVRPISEDTGWDPALVIGAISAGLFVAAAVGILVGRALDRTGPRPLMIAGSLTGMLALILVGLAPNLPVFAAAWLVAGTAQAAIPTTARIAVITGTATGAILLLALLPGPAPMLIVAGMLAGAVRGCHTLLQATIVADWWGTTGLGTLQGRFAAPLTAATALAPAAGPAIATWLGSYTAMSYAMAVATGTAAFIAAAASFSRGSRAG